MSLRLLATFPGSLLCFLHNTFVLGYLISPQVRLDRGTALLSPIGPLPSFSIWPLSKGFGPGLVPRAVVLAQHIRPVKPFLKNDTVCWVGLIRP